MRNGVWLVWIWRMGRKRIPLDVLSDWSSRVASLWIFAWMAWQKPHRVASDSNISDANRSASSICIMDEGTVEATADCSTNEGAGDLNA